MLPAWQQRHREVQQSRARLAELDALADSQAELTLQDACEQARLTESVGERADAAFEQFRKLHERAPDDPNLCFALGQRLLGRDDEAGFTLVERAIGLDEDIIAPGCGVLRDYCWRKGREQEANGWHARLVERAQLLNQAREERVELLIKDQLEQHGLAEDVIADLRRQLQAIPGLRKAYLVRKRVKHLPHRPLFVLGHVVRPWWGVHNKRRAAEVQQGTLANVSFPGEAIVVNVEGENYQFGRKLRMMRRSRIF